MIEYTVKAWPDGTKKWYHNGQRATEVMSTGCDGKLVKIDGQKYRLVEE